MSTVEIKTPFNVKVAAQQAGAGLRVLSFVLDIIFIGLYLWAITYLFFDVWQMNLAVIDDNAFDVDRLEFIEVIYTVLLFPAFFYSLWTEYLFRGQTFGKMITGIRVVKLEGYRAGFSEYFTRWAFRFIDFWTGLFLLLFFIPLFGQEIAYMFAGLLFFLSGFVAFLLVVQTKNSQRLGDIIAGTTVLKLKEKQSIDITILKEIQETYVPMYSQVIRLSDNDARIIKDTFTLARRKKDFKTLKRLRKKLEDVMDVESDQRDVEFIDTVLKDFNYYTQKL